MKAKASKRPKLVPISEEMKQWSAMLSQEVSNWPNISSRLMFGFLSLYRKNAIFAALPHTRGVMTPNSFMFRFAPMPSELRAKAQQTRQIKSEERSPDAKWYIFELTSADDVRDALWWLNQAYEAAERKRR